MEYAGESLAKKVARVRTYLRAKQMLDAAGVAGKLTAVVLPGPEFSEHGCLAHILKPARLIVVDRDQEVIDRCFDLMDERCFWGVDSVEGFTRDLSEVAPCEPIHFANLDLMSNLNGDIGNQVANIALDMATGGVVAVTYLRARETGEVRSLVRDKSFMRHLRSARKARRRMGSDPARTVLLVHAFNVGRFMLHADCLMIDKENWRAEFFRLMGKERFIAVSSFCYQAKVSPMSTCMLQVLGPRLAARKSKKYEKAINGCGTRLGRRLVSCKIKRNPMNELLREADLLDAHGYSKQQVAEIFDVSVQTMAAWRAHRSMGTYEGAA